MEINMYSNIYTLIMAIVIDGKTSRRKPSRSALSRVKSKKAEIKKVVKNTLKELSIGTPEVKIFDTISATTNISTTLSGMSFGMGISQGLTDLTRVGKAVKLVRYMFRMSINPNITATTPGEVRVIWIHQHNPNQSLQTPANTLQTVTNIHSPYQFDTTDYTVLYDKTFSFSVTDFKNQFLTVSLPFVKGKRVEWTEGDTTGNSANLVKGYIRGFIMYNNFGGAVPTFDLYQRAYFVDA